MSACMPLEAYFLEAACARSARASRRLNLASWMTPGECQHKPDGNGGVKLTGIGIAGEVAGPRHVCLTLVLARGDGVHADRGDDRGVGQLGLRRDDAVGDVVVDALCRTVLVPFYMRQPTAGPSLTECSSCFTSRTAPSLNVHLTMSVSSDVPLTHSLFSSLDQKSLKFWSLIRCHTSLNGASMTADSLTEVEVGMLADMMGGDGMCSWVGSNYLFV